MRVAILHNAVPDDAPLEDQDTLVQVEAVSAALARLGHEPATVSCTLDLAALRDELLRLRPDVVFNLVESLAEADSLVYLPSAVLDVLGLPYTGSRTESLFLTTHKLLAKERLRQAGLPTPAWMESKSELSTKDTKATKNWDDRMPCYRRSSCFFVFFVDHQRCLGPGLARHGRRRGARGVDLAEVRKRLAERAARSAGPCFAEQFIEGREFNLSVLAGPTGPRSSRPPRSTSPLSRRPNRGSWAIGPSGRPIRSSITTRPAGSTSRRPTGRCWTNSVSWPRSAGRCLGFAAGSGSIFGWMPPDSRGFWRSTPTRV